MEVAAQDVGDEEWTEITNHENLIDNVVYAQCKEGVSLCAYFPVGYIPMI